MSFTPKQNPISGLFDYAPDLGEGEFTYAELQKRNEQRAAAFNQTVQDGGSYGDAMSREPKPSDFLNANDRAGAVNADRYGQ